MKRTTNLFLFMLFCFAAAYGFQQWSAHPPWVDFNSKSNLIVKKTAFSCTPPSDLGVKNLKNNEATIYWEDNSGSAWEYYVVPYGDPKPSTFTTTTNQEEVITQDQNGNTLQPNTLYEFYVRTDCGADGMSSWAGPFDFKTLYLPFAVPFAEGFNTASTTFDCWTIVDGNQDATSPTGNNIWYEVGSIYAYEGNQSMYFKGDPDKAHDDWLISPAITMTGGIYAISYYYKTATSVADENEFEVLLSQNGVETNQFTTVLLPKQTYKTGSYKQKIVYVQGITADVHLAWHITATQQTEIYLDLVTVEEVDCIGIDLEDITITDLKPDEVTFEWTDDNNSQWEHYVQAAGGGTPSGGGILTNTKEETIIRVNGGGNLQPDTEYEFWIRSTCENGKYSEWVGPIIFRTPCVIQSLPFWEGFNSNSPTVDCWRMIDNNMDGSSTGGGIDFNRWFKSSLLRYEGDTAMHFIGNRGEQHDDWLISPAFTLDATKYYKLKYHYQPSSSEESYLKILLSNNGTKLKDFNTTLLSKTFTGVASYAYYEETLFIHGIGGVINIAFHQNGEGVVQLVLDNVFLEEVTGCPEPILLDTKNEEKDKATIFWEDDFGANWEYIVQKTGDSEPLTTTTGTAVNNKEVIVDTDQNGDKLTPNTDYEFYVRTDCGNGEYSIWSGPFTFTTACDAYTIPFLEGFEDVRDFRCWTVVDGNTGVVNPLTNSWERFTGLNHMNAYEGQSWVIYNAPSGANHDNWLISPALKTNKEMYVLKYRYLMVNTDPNSSNSNEFEVLLSTQGVNTTDFTTIVVPKGTHQNTSNNNNSAKHHKEIIAFFNGVSGDINLAWHATPTNNTQIVLDNITIKKVETCPEPYYVTVTEQTSTSITIEWKQEGDLSEWEVIVVNYGKDENSLPIQTGTVTGTPKTTITGLDEGKAYTIYVRAKCTNEESNSDWSTPVDGTTLVGKNNDCSGAIEIPINTALECVDIVSGSFVGASDSFVPEPDCDIATAKKDIWFKFTATDSNHLLTIEKWYVFFNRNRLYYGALYEQSCDSITATALDCFSWNPVNGGVYSFQKHFTDLTPGHTYYIRLSVILPVSIEDNNFFNLCLTTPAPVKLNPSGDLYTTDELVKDVLVRSASNCDLISNVHYQFLDGRNTFNTLAYFNKDQADFFFDEGIVLSTTDWADIPGPYKGYLINSRYRSYDLPYWMGSPELNDILDKEGGWGDNKIKRTSVLEFDFIPLKDTISFEYLFASDSWHHLLSNSCSSELFSLFMVWLEDSTGQGKNWAVVPGSIGTPITTLNIRDSEKIGITCANTNKDFFGEYYDKDDAFFRAPVNFPGMTISMQMTSLVVTPGEKYHLKLIVADFKTPGRTMISQSSAVFLNGGSFDLGNNLSLGEDLSVENGNALCYGDTRIINIETAVSEKFNKQYQWYKDDVLIPGANTPDLEIREAGEYKVVMKLTNLNCELTDTIKVEMYPVISDYVKKPQEVEICRYSLQDRTVAFSAIEAEMFSVVERSGYKVNYYHTEAEAKQGKEPAIDTVSYVVEGMEDMVLYVRIEDVDSGCFEVFMLPIKIEQGAMANKPKNVTVCAAYEFPPVSGNQYYYTEPGGQGTVYQSGDVLTKPGEHTIYLLQVNSEEGCYEEIAYQVNITAPVTADIFEDKTLSCEYYELAPLSEHNRYYTEPDGPKGHGTQLYEGMQILHKQTVYVYASSDDGLCTDESSFTIDYEDCPIPRGISPNNDGLNDVFDLTSHGVESIKIYNRWGTEVYSHGEGYTTQWHGQSKSGKQLPDGTYYYVIQAHGKIRTGWVQINK